MVATLLVTGIFFAPEAGAIIRRCSAHESRSRVPRCRAGRATCFSWKPCQDAPKSLYADIKAVTLTPEEPAAGDTVHFAIDGTAKIDVSAGSLDIGVMYSGLPIYRCAPDLRVRVRPP